MSNPSNTTAAPQQRGTGFWKENLREYGMLISLLAIVLIFAYLTNGVILRPLNLTNIILQNSYVVIMALGMLMIIVTGHIDLSVVGPANVELQVLSRNKLRPGEGVGLSIDPSQVLCFGRDFDLSKKESLEHA